MPQAENACCLSLSYLDSGYRSWCQSDGLTACFLGCAKCWTLSEQGMHGFSLASGKQMTGSLTEQLRASCRPSVSNAMVSGQGGKPGFDCCALDCTVALAMQGQHKEEYLGTLMSYTRRCRQGQGVHNESWDHSTTRQDRGVCDRHTGTKLW